MKASDPEYIPQLKILFDDLSKHIHEEEEHDLPELEKILDRPESADMAQTFERTKMFVPTRSHPAAGENPIFESVLGLLAAPVDRLGDMLRKFPK